MDCETLIGRYYDYVYKNIGYEIVRIPIVRKIYLVEVNLYKIVECEICEQERFTYYCDEEEIRIHVEEFENREELFNEINRRNIY